LQLESRRNAAPITSNDKANGSGWRLSEQHYLAVGGALGSQNGALQKPKPQKV
jgi:hypothetical protein